MGKNVNGLANGEHAVDGSTNGFTNGFSSGVDNNEDEDVFDPAIHLAPNAFPTRTFTLADLLLRTTASTTPVAATTPFPLLSAAGIRAYRRSLFRPSTLTSCAAALKPGTMVLRNVAAHSRFVREMWAHPVTTRVVADALGVEQGVRVVMPVEVAHTNVQTRASAGGVAEMLDEVRGMKEEPGVTRVVVREGEERGEGEGEGEGVIPWHYDSYPYVCVLMLSDTTHMVGGETYIMKGDGSAQKIEGPALGHCVVLQGGQVRHLAARAYGTTERITTITSYVARVPGLYDSSHLTNVRPYSQLDVLYPQWISYRLAKLRSEIERVQKLFPPSSSSSSSSSSSPSGSSSTSSTSSPCPVEDLHRLHRFAEQQNAYLKRTARQLVSPELRDKVVSRFGTAALFALPATWRRVRAHPEFPVRVQRVMEDASWWRSDATMRAYVRDWWEAKGMVLRGEELEGQDGKLCWCELEMGEYTFGDELLRQGLWEPLMEWMDWTGLMELA